MPDCILSDSELHFLMKLSKLTEVYSKLAYAGVEISVIRKKFRLVQEIVEEDNDYWKYA